MAYSNVHRGARISPTKVRPVVNQIRGKSLDEALTLMTMSKRRAAVFIKAALNAARANAVDAGELSSAQARKLVVTEARVDSGPTMKRFQPKDRGRAHAILKRTSHITVAVDTKF
jgi:large subunit ribosomal protein L22